MGQRQRLEVIRLRIRNRDRVLNFFSGTHSHMEGHVMKSAKKLMTAFAVTAGLLGTGVGSAVMAASVGGGTWNYGVGLTGTFGYSDYLHNSKTHSASVGRTKSDCNKVTKTKGVWAQSKYTKIPPTGLNYWWSVS